MAAVPDIATWLEAAIPPPCAALPRGCGRNRKPPRAGPSTPHTRQWAQSRRSARTGDISDALRSSLFLPAFYFASRLAWDGLSIHEGNTLQPPHPHKGGSNKL